MAVSHLSLHSQDSDSPWCGAEKAAEQLPLCPCAVEDP